MKTLAIILFILMYVLLIIFKKHRAKIAIATAIIFVVTGILPYTQVFAAIDWNILHPL